MLTLKQREHSDLLILALAWIGQSRVISSAKCSSMKAQNFLHTEPDYAFPLFLRECNVFPHNQP